MRVRVASVVLAATLAVASGAAAGGGTSLTIKAMPDGGKPGVFKRYTLRCSPAGGTLPQPARACARLARIARPFAPVPGDMACTEIYGGPQEAIVVGTYGGKRVWARFSRTNGCQIARWERVRFLFPIPVGVR
ncbi:MAG: subtilase-type protease inhibitor [Actinomycetota bacterium]|nr:subtilase-type protease inhibitor [Actinomycetota bacterium]